jgi:hypothetical protein
VARVLWRQGKCAHDVRHFGRATHDHRQVWIGVLEDFVDIREGWAVGALGHRLGKLERGVTDSDDAGSGLDKGMQVQVRVPVTDPDERHARHIRPARSRCSRTISTSAGV